MRNFLRPPIPAKAGFRLPSTKWLPPPPSRTRALPPHRNANGNGDARCARPRAISSCRRGICSVSSHDCCYLSGACSSVSSVSSASIATSSCVSSAPTSFVGTHHHDCHYLRLQRENRQAHQRRRPLARSGVRLLCELHPLLLQHVLAAVCLHRRDFLHHPAGQSLRNHRYEKCGHEFPTFAPAFLHGGRPLFPPPPLLWVPTSSPKAM